uniref:Uncharacterized protein n=1 Tax=Eutreptiella gymnastica TaxID=73025 RepID=A0A7S1ID35_9EUGL
MIFEFRGSQRHNIDPRAIAKCLLLSCAVPDVPHEYKQQGAPKYSPKTIPSTTLLWVPNNATAAKHILLNGILEAPYDSQWQSHSPLTLTNVVGTVHAWLLVKMLHYGWVVG